MVAHARKALASNPNYIDAMNWLTIGLSNLGHYEEADAIHEQMLLTDPLSVSGRASYALWLSSLGRIEEAHELADQILAQGPSAKGHHDVVHRSARRSLQSLDVRQ